VHTPRHRETGRPRAAQFAPRAVSSGNRKIYRLSLRGNRRINHALQMAAVTQIRHAHSDGRAYFDRKIAQGKTRKEALRCLKRKISDAVFARLQADARKDTALGAPEGPGGQPGNDSDSSAAGSHPADQLFGQATPEPDATLRPPTPRQRTVPPKPTSKKTCQNP
jgi:transposase